MEERNQELFRDDSELTELTEEQLRQLDEAWDDPDGEPEAGYVAETDDLEEDHPGAPEEAKPGERAADGARDPEPEGPGKQTGGAQEPGIFTLKHLDEVRTVGRDEVVRLAQQGMDYDRVRSERDQLRKYRDELGPALEMVRDFAGKSGLAPEEYLELCRRRELSGRGMDGRGVNERVFSERREAFLRSGQIGMPDGFFFFFAQKRVFVNLRTAL
jgi:hypothetical protein